jgi:hypothetical protein
VDRVFSASPEIDQLAAALALAQLDLPAIEKDKNVSTGKYSYTYADLASILKLIRPHLAKQGLSVLQPVSVEAKGAVVVRTILLHASGQWLSEKLTWPVTDGSDAQKVGSGISYGRRYGYCAMVGIQPEDEDDDAEQAREQPRRAPARRKAAAPEDSGEEMITTTDADGKPGGQKARLVGILREHGINNKAFGEYVHRTYGYTGWETIKRKDYDAIVAFAQNWGKGIEPVVAAIAGDADADNRGEGPDEY